jgi:hypothetical protein
MVLDIIIYSPAQEQFIIRCPLEVVPLAPFVSLITIKQLLFRSIP